MRVDIARQLDDAQVRAVLALVDAAGAADGVTPVSEQGLLDVRHGGDAGTRHVLAYDGSRLVGYAHLDHVLGAMPALDGVASEAADDVAGGVSSEVASASAEIVVHPAARRRGVGTSIVRRLEALTPQLRLWAHGHLAMAREFALRDGYGSVRELLQLSRPLGKDSEPLPRAVLPDGFAARAFEVDRDEHAWLTLNARAFADHPEQGAMTLSDLREREVEPWFDPAGLILVLDVSKGADVLAASHWTKVHDGDPDLGEPPVGEVYVVGVDPAYQGRGLGTAVTVLGLEHLQRRGLTRAMLYVDGDNGAAVATYGRLGFTRAGVDVMYSGSTSSGVASGVPR